MLYLDEWENETTLTHRYLAQIAYWIVRVNTPSKKKGPKLDDFFFTAKDESVPKEKDREKYLANTKAGWLGAVGMDKTGKPKKKKR